MSSTKTGCDYLVMLYHLNKCLLKLLYVNERKYEVHQLCCGILITANYINYFFFLFPSEGISGIDVLAS